MKDKSVLMSGVTAYDLYLVRVPRIDGLPPYRTKVKLADHIVKFGAYPENDNIGPYHGSVRVIYMGEDEVGTGSVLHTPPRLVIDVQEPEVTSRSDEREDRGLMSRVAMLEKRVKQLEAFFVK